MRWHTWKSSRILFPVVVQRIQSQINLNAQNVEHLQRRWTWGYGYTISVKNVIGVKENNLEPKIAERVKLLEEELEDLKTNIVNLKQSGIIVSIVEYRNIRQEISFLHTEIQRCYKYGQKMPKGVEMLPQFTMHPGQAVCGRNAKRRKSHLSLVRE